MSQRPALYNPKLVCAAALIFTPIFGAALQARNWMNLGKPENAAASRMWIRSTFWLLLVYLVMQTVFRNEPVMNWLGPYFLIVLWGAWMLTSGWQQLAHCARVVGRDYDPLPMGRPIFLGLGGWIAWSLVTFTITVGLALAGIDPMPTVEAPKTDDSGVVIRVPKEGGDPVVEPLPPAAPKTGEAGK